MKNDDLNDWKEFVTQEVSKRIRNLRKNSYFYKTSKILNNEIVKRSFIIFKNNLLL